MQRDLSTGKGFKPFKMCRLTYAFLVFTDATNLIVFSEKCSIGNSCRLHLGASLSNRLTPTEGFRVDRSAHLPELLQ